MPQTQPTINDLAAQQKELSRQIAERSIPEVQDAVTLLAGLSETTTALRGISARLGSGLARDVLNSVVYALDQAPNNLAIALANLERDAMPTLGSAG